jgi:hypothetical protein
MMDVFFIVLIPTLWYTFYVRETKIDQYPLPFLYTAMSNFSIGL